MADAVIARYVLDDIHNALVSADGGNGVLDFVDPDGSGAQPMALSKRYRFDAAQRSSSAAGHQGRRLS